MSGCPCYSDPIDMEGARALLVEAHLLDVAPHLPGFATLRVQCTDDGTAERKSWADEGVAIDLVPGFRYRAVIEDVRGAVRVAVGPLAQDGVGRIWIRLTRLP